MPAHISSLVGLIWFAGSTKPYRPVSRSSAVNVYCERTTSFA